MGWTDGKRTVSGLPMKSLQLRHVLLDPLRTIAFDLANQRRHVDGAAQSIENVYVVGDPTNGDRRALVLLADPGQVGVDSLPKDCFHQQGLSVLRGEDDVEVN